MELYGLGTLQHRYYTIVTEVQIGRRFKENEIFLCPRDDSQGALTFAPVCLSVRPFVTLYGIEFV